MPYRTELLKATGGMSLRGDFAQWVLDTEDAIATVRMANHISDAEEKGLHVGDLVLYRQWADEDLRGQGDSVASPTAMALMIVLSVGSSGADLSDGLTIPVTNT